MLGVLGNSLRFLISGRIEKLGDFDPLFFERLAKPLDMRPEMIRRHEIQIVDFFEKKRPNFGKQFGGCDRTAVMLGRDLIILTEKTLAGAAAKENRSGTLGSRKGRFFPEMGSDERNTASRTLPAKA
jgi:hypothetical protein